MKHDGGFSYALTGLQPLEGQVKAIWVQAQDVACTQITLP